MLSNISVCELYLSVFTHFTPVTRNILVEVLSWFLLGLHLRVQYLGHRVNMYSAIIDTAKEFPKVTGWPYTSTNNIEKSQQLILR